MLNILFIIYVCYSIGKLMDEVDARAEIKRKEMERSIAQMAEKLGVENPLTKSKAYKVPRRRRSEPMSLPVPGFGIIPTEDRRQ